MQAIDTSISDEERERLIQATADRLGTVNTSAEVREIARTLAWLVNGRSAEQIARMEREKGLR